MNIPKYYRLIVKSKTVWLDGVRKRNSDATKKILKLVQERDGIGWVTISGNTPEVLVFEYIPARRALHIQD